MTMCTTVLDEVPGKRSIIIANLLSFLKSDTAWYENLFFIFTFYYYIRYLIVFFLFVFIYSKSVRNLDNDIAKKQNEILNPLVQWFQQHYNVPLVVESSFMRKKKLKYQY